jgi:hypothetical protein
MPDPHRPDLHQPDLHQTVSAGTGRSAEDEGGPADRRAAREPGRAEAHFARGVAPHSNFRPPICCGRIIPRP